MAKTKYNYAVIVGRFQPAHNVHIKLVEHGLEIAEQTIVVLGSAHSAPTFKNPFTPAMREKMIRSCFTEEQNKNLIFKAVRDYPYNDNNWIAEVQNAVTIEMEEYLDRNNIKYSDVTHRKALAQVKVCLVGYYKDSSSYYLKLFPQWQFEEFAPVTVDARILNATDIRNLWFENPTTRLMASLSVNARNAEIMQINKPKWKEYVPEPIVELMDEFSKSQTYLDLVAEHEYTKKYKEDTKFVGVPYAPIFVTTDAVVTCKGHVLLVRRGHQPGRGLLALVGGFLQPDLLPIDNMIKELKEETRINIPVPVLKSKIRAEHFFAHPHRSLRGRTVTYAYHINLDNYGANDELPLVKGGDDAAKAFWMPMSEISASEDQFFEDHVHIVRYFLGF